LEVGERLAGAIIRVAGCRAIAGGRTLTISPDLACMRIGNTEHHHRTACSCVPSRHHWSAGCGWASGCQAGVSSHAARIARSNAGPCIVRVPCADACVGACSQLHALECPAPARVSLACLCILAHFIRPANRVIKHKELCVCVSGPCFLYALIYFCSRVDMLVGTHKRHPFSSRPRPWSLPLPSHPAAAVLPAGGLRTGQTLSPVVSVLVAFEHEATPF